MELIRPIEYIREDRCPSCKTDRSLELYNKNNKPLHFTLSLDMGLPYDSAGKELRYFRCTICQKVFDIDHTAKDHIPKPLEDKKFIEFVNRYKLLYSKH